MPCHQQALPQIGMSAKIVALYRHFRRMKNNSQIMFKPIYSSLYSDLKTSHNTSTIWRKLKTFLYVKFELKLKLRVGNNTTRMSEHGFGVLILLKTIWIVIDSATSLWTPVIDVKKTTDTICQVPRYWNNSRKSNNLYIISQTSFVEVVFKPWIETREGTTKSTAVCWKGYKLCKILI